MRRPARPARCQVEAMVPGYPAMTTTVEGTDVDAEFEGIGGNDGANEAFAQTFLNFAPFARQVAAAVSAYGAQRRWRLLAGVFEVGDQDFCGEAIVGEDQGLLATLDQLDGEAAGFVQVAAADPKLAVDDRWVVEDDVLVADWAHRCD